MRQLVLILGIVLSLYQPAVAGGYGRQVVVLDERDWGITRDHMHYRVRIEGRWEIVPDRRVVLPNRARKTSIAYDDRQILWFIPCVYRQCE